MVGALWLHDNRNDQNRTPAGRHKHTQYKIYYDLAQPRDVATGAQGRGRLGRDAEGHHEHRRHLWSAHLRAARVRREDDSAEPDS